MLPFFIGYRNLSDFFAFRYAFYALPSAPCPMPHAPCPMPHAPCPLPHAPCAMPHALCAMPYARNEPGGISRPVKVYRHPVNDPVLLKHLSYVPA